MKVKAVWEFDVDTSDLNPEYIDIPTLAKDLTERELASVLEKHDISAEDFEYIVNAKWVMETETYRSGDVHITHRCSNCGKLGHVSIFKTEAWEEYHKDHYNPTLSKFCPDCGREMNAKGE